MGILDRLAGTLDELVSQTPVDAAAEIESEVRLARALAERGEADEARARLTDLARRYPRAAEVLEARGEVWRRAGRLDDAVADFGRAVDLDGGRPSAWLELGEALAELERPEPARDALRRALTLPTVDVTQRRRALLGLGRVYGKMSQYARATRELRKLVVLAPDEPVSVAAFGHALLAAGEPEGAEWLARAARLPGGQVSMLLEAAAVKATEMGGDLDTRPHESTRVVPEGKTVEGKTVEGGRAGQGVPTTPGSSELEDDPALRLLREASSRVPALPGVRGALARRLAELGALAMARLEAEAETAAHPGDPEAWSTLRAIHARAGEFAAAIADGRREASLGRPVTFGEALRLALGARDRDVLVEVLSSAHGGEGETGHLEARAFQAGTADWAAIATLARLAPDAISRRFVVTALSPPPVPRGSVLGLLGWARDFAGRRGGPRGLDDLISAMLSLTLPLSRAVEAFDRPLSLAVMGEFNAGKSSFVNALVGASVARVGVTPTTATINVLRYGLASGARVRFHDGGVRDLRTDQMSSYLANLDDAETARIRLIEIFSPTESLRRIEIVDTPGLNALRVEHERVAREFLTEADAVVWVFALGQAAKASERDALDVVRAAGKQVLGVINKIDAAEPGDVEEVMAHVERGLGSRVGRLVPFSARWALQARRAQQAHEPDLLRSSGLDAVEAALEELFYRHARELKHATAHATLERFAAEARGLVAAAAAQHAREAELLSRETAGLRSMEGELRSTLAGERIALRARIDRAMRATAADVREFGRPRAWPFGEPRFDSGHEADLADLLDDAVGEAIAATDRTLRARVANPAATLSEGTRGELHAGIAATVNAFEAYVRGTLEGAAARFFRVDAGRSRLELPALANTLASYAPDPDRRLFHALELHLRAVFVRAHAALDARGDELELGRLFLEELVMRPLADFEAAVANASPASEAASRLARGS